jgi:dUTP pyrophosphatase
MKLKIKKLNPDAILPSYGTPGSAGLDLHAQIPHEIYLQPGVRFTCATGIAIELPDGFEAQVRGRSGLAKKHGVTVVQGVATIDSDYTGEIFVLLINHGDEAYKIMAGDRIAQMVIAPVIRVELELAGELTETERGDGAFGSTGR